MQTHLRKLSASKVNLIQDNNYQEMYFKAQQHHTFCTFQSTKFSKEYEWEPEIMHLPLSNHRAVLSPAICSSSSYHLQSTTTSLLLYREGLPQYICFPTQKFSRVRTENTLSQRLYNLNLWIGPLTDSWAAQWLYLPSSTLKDLHLREAYFQNASSCPALPYIKTLNWVNFYLLSAAR